MKRTSSLLIAALILAGCAATATVTGTNSATAASPLEAATGSEPTPISEPPARVEAQGGSQLSTPTPSDRSLNLRDVSIDTTVYELIFDKGTESQIPIAIAVPAGWVFSPDLPGFSDGASSIELIAGCAGPCEIKNWDRALNADGAFFDAGGQLFPDDAAQGFYGGSSDRGDVDSESATLDDDSGISLTAHTRYDVGWFVGCTAVAASGSPPLDELSDLCITIEVDWSATATSTPEFVVTERLTETAAAIVADPAPGLERQSFSVEGHGLISIALPPGSTVTEDGDEIRLSTTTSIFPDLELTADCDGICGPQDWGVKLQEPRNIIGRLRLRLDLVNDSPIEGGWLLSGGDDDDDHFVAVVRWDDQAERFFTCRASIDSRDLALIEDMLTICLSAEPDWSTW